MPDHAANKLIAAHWAAGILAEPPGTCVLLDLETSGLKGAEHEILQVGLLSLRDEVILDSFVRPRWKGLATQSIPAAATAVNHITDAMVSDAPTLTELLPLIEKYTAGRRVIIYNAGFEMQMLTGCLSRRGSADAVAAWMNGPKSWECCMDMYAQFYGQWNDYHRSYWWQKLSEHSPIADHGAINDCRATLALLKRMAAFAESF